MLPLFCDVIYEPPIFPSSGGSLLMLLPLLLGAAALAVAIPLAMRRWKRR